MREKTSHHCGSMVSGSLVACVILVSAALAACAPVGATATPTPWVLHPYSPMFSLTAFPPTATPSVRPIPPLPPGKVPSTPEPLPEWIASVSPGALSEVSLTQFSAICIVPIGYQLDEIYPALLALFRAGERARDHLILTVNGVVPSELTWQEIIVPNSTHPGTAWVGVRNHPQFCWIADLTLGDYRIDLSYPTEAGSQTYTWTFTIVQ